MLSNKSQQSSDVIEQWSCIVASLQQVLVAGSLLMCVLQFWISTNSTKSVIRKLFSFVLFYLNNKAAAGFKPILTVH